MDRYALICVAIASAVTILLRALPFVFFGGKKTPKTIEYLGTVLPCAIMGMLVVYCLKGTSFSSISGFLPALIASAIVVFSYILKKNTLVSVISGTVCYMFLIQVVFK